MEAFRQFAPYNPNADEHKAAVKVAFIDQSARDIKRKLQKLEGIQDKSLKDLVQVAERVYYHREPEEEKKERERREQEEREEKRKRCQDRRLTKILATVVEKGQGPRERAPGNQRKPWDRDQCAYCKERGHWAKECPKNPRSRKSKEGGPRAQVLALGEDSD